jgi:hypothetical protein
METKICSGKHGCGHELPIDQFGKYFSKQYNTTYYRTYCKECSNKRQARASRIRRHGSDKYKDPTYKTIKVKKCIGEHGCGKELPVEMFQLIQDKRRTYPYYATYCKNCAKEFGKRYMERYQERTPEQKEQYNAYHRQYYRENSEELKKHYNLEARRISRDKWFAKKLEEDPDFERRRNKRAADNLTDWYVKTGLKQMGIIDHSPEIINAKRLQLLLYRETKKLKNGKRSESINN